jgi:hypothetical protein
MDELSKVTLPALIALIGTSVTTFVGYRQWKRRVERHASLFARVGYNS